MRTSGAIFLLSLWGSSAYLPFHSNLQWHHPTFSRKCLTCVGDRLSRSNHPLYSTGFGKVEPKKSSRKAVSARPDLRSTREELLELVPRMTGTAEECRTIENLVNVLEDLYQPTQTLAFLNMALEGTWQLLLSTRNDYGTPDPTRFRLRGTTQTIQCDHTRGSSRTEIKWDWAEPGNDEKGQSSVAAAPMFTATGTFTVRCAYSIEQGSRMALNLEEHVLEPARGSAIPRDVPKLVGLLHRSMPKELFDPSQHSIDTTYLDANLRIVRYTGPQFEGVRDIFLRQTEQ